MNDNSHIVTDTGYPIVFGSIDSLGIELERLHLSPGACLLITDDTVYSLHGERIESRLVEAGWRPRVFILDAGESSKSIGVLSRLYDWALSDTIDRSIPVFAVGGGVVGDLSGYFAATLFRGLPLIHIPTTLVAQVDSSIGGKTGINHDSGKNLIGAFYRPQLVLSDPSVLQTLPDSEWRSGLSETVKHALIANAPLFQEIESNWTAILDRSLDVSGIIRRSAQVKVSTVVEDEFESGRRMLLNFGHTFGHGLEKLAGFGFIGHGEAVALGMVAATILSSHYSTEIDSSRLTPLLSDLTPSALPNFTGRDIVGAMQSDKKRSSAGLRLVLLNRIGDAYVRSGVGDDEIARAFDAAVSDVAR